ncbi:MAG: hypothetical protein ACLSFJ_04090 [Holdemania filiformis]
MISVACRVMAGRLANDFRVLCLVNIVFNALLMVYSVSRAGVIGGGDDDCAVSRKAYLFMLRQFLPH